MIRTLPLYQPYASLMLHGKIETRWVNKNKKPPFPLGKYIIYSTKKSYSWDSFKELSGEYFEKAMRILNNEATPNGVAICTCDLVKVEDAYPLLMPETYVGLERIGEQLDLDSEASELVIDGQKLRFLHFQNVKRIKPFPFKGGKQGVGFLSKEDEDKIVYI